MRCSTAGLRTGQRVTVTRVEFDTFATVTDTAGREHTVMVGDLIPEHTLHCMTAQYRCVDCDRTETDLHQSGASVSGYDLEYAPIPTNT